MSEGDGKSNTGKSNTALKPMLMRRTLPPNFTLPLLEDGAASAADAGLQTLLSHIKEHKNYFTAKRTPVEWADWVQASIKDEWDEHAVRIAAHETERRSLMSEIEEIRKSIEDQDRIQSVKLMMAVKERTRTDDRDRLRKQKEDLIRLRDIEGKAWKEVLERVGAGTVMSDQIYGSPLELGDAGGPLSP
ncbi:hypothetical protein BDZ97DRAFT_626313 [Flammula alnicola]|nr:hypothetical protein BDZ97DRAFT_626313 [Flammula alnicola]